jgi:hypothetical protein
MAHDDEPERVGHDPMAAAALAGDEVAFGQLVERHRRELHVHCYRMLGQGLIDELYLMVDPQAVAGGTPIFSTPADLTLVEARRFDGSDKCAASLRGQTLSTPAAA